MRRYLILFVIGILATLPYWSCYQDMDDEAITVLGILRLLQGQLPYQDWTTRHTPGTYFACLPVFWLLGPGALTTRICMATISSLTGLVIQAISQRLTRRHLCFLPWTVWTCSALFEKAQLNYHWFGVLGSTCTLWAIMAWVTPDSHKRQADLVGFCAAITLWFLQSNGLTSCLMIILVWLRLRPAGLWRVIRTYLLTQVLLWLPWLGLASKVWENHIDILGRHMQFNRIGYSWSFLAEQLQQYSNLDWHQPLFLLSAWTYFVHLAVQYGLFYPLIILYLVKCEKSPQRAHLALAYACLAWAITSGYCQTPSYLNYAAPALWLTIPGLLTPASRWIGYVWIILEIVGWGLRTLTMQQIFIYPCTTRDGGYWHSDVREARELNQLHAFIQEHCPPHSPVLAYPYLTRLYTTEYLSNPIADPILLPWIWSKSAFDDCVQRLEKQKVAYIFYRPLSVASIHADYPAVPIEEFQAESDQAWLQISRNYQPVWQGHLYQIWRRR